MKTYTSTNKEIRIYLITMSRTYFKPVKLIASNTYGITKICKTSVTTTESVVLCIRRKRTRKDDHK